MESREIFKELYSGFWPIKWITLEEFKELYPPLQANKLNSDVGYND